MTCPHGMPTPKACLDCMDEGLLPPPPRPEPERADSPPVTARFDANCPSCNLPMVTGKDRIVRTTRDRWVHVGCVR